MKPAPVLLALIAAVLVNLAAAQTAPSATPAAKAPASGAPATAASPMNRPQATPPLRNVTGSFAAAVTAKMPEPAPEPAPAPRATPAEEPIAPNNAQITRLNPFTVYGEKPLIFKEREIYSQSDLRKIALQNYRGLRLMPLGFLNNLNRPVAEIMYFEEERAKDIQALNESAAASARGGDLESANEIRAQTINAYSRPGEAWKNPTRESASPNWTNEIKKVGALR